MAVKGPICLLLKSMPFYFHFVFFMLCLLSAVDFSHAQKVNWKHLGPHQLPAYGIDSGSWSANGMGWIESVEVAASNPRVIYAGSNTGGLYRTKNGGKTWKLAFDIERLCGVTDIVVNPNNHKELWVATGTTVFDYDWGYGVLHSTNGGKSWARTGLSFEPHELVPLWCLKQSSVNPNLFFACSETDIFRSRDRGLHWETVYDEDARARVHFRHLSVHNSDSSKALASGDKILATRDGGNTWSDRTYLMKYRQYQNKYTANDSLPDRYATALNPSNNDEVLVLYEYAGYNYIEKSRDFGRSFELIARNRTFDRVDRNHAEIAFHPSDTNVIFVGGVRFYISKDRGKTFITATQPVVGAANEIHDDIRALSILNNGTIMLGNDGGVGVSMDMGVTWNNISGKGLTVTQFFDIAVDDGRVVGGCQDLSSMIYTEGGWKNTSKIYGDGGNNLIRGSDVFVMQSGNLRKGTFANNQWEYIPVPFNPERFSYPLQFSPFDSNQLWATDHHIWAYDLSTKHWKKLTSEVKQGITKIVALAVHEPSGYVLFAKDQPTWNPEPSGMKERLYTGIRNERGGFVWTDITANLGILAWREITGICVNPDNDMEWYVCLYGYDDSDLRFKVFRTLDGGTTWVNFSDGLPNINTFCIKYWRGQLLLGTDGGMYRRDVKADSWEKLRGGMPNAHVTDIEVDETAGMIYAATYGTGVWYFKIGKKLRRMK